MVHGILRSGHLNQFVAMSSFELVLLWLAGAFVWVQPAAVHVFALEMVELLSLPLSKHNQQRMSTP
jgi:hypothetical protein